MLEADTRIEWIHTGISIKIAKNLNTNSLPKNMTLGDTPIATCDTANVFGQFFANKVITL